jgi:hypothetical protein
VKLLQKSKKVLFGALMLCLATGIPPSIAQQNTQTPQTPYSDRYVSQKDAETRAKEIGCTGSYRNGQFWMPCGNSIMYRNCWDRYYKK